MGGRVDREGDMNEWGEAWVYRPQMPFQERNTGYGVGGAALGLPLKPLPCPLPGALAQTGHIGVSAQQQHGLPDPE
jgi:hypothetical protein